MACTLQRYLHAHTNKFLTEHSLDMTLPVVVSVISGPFSLRGLSTSVIFVSSQLFCRAAAVKLQDDPALPEIWQKGSLERKSVLRSGRAVFKSLPASCGALERSLANQKIKDRGGFKRLDFLENLALSCLEKFPSAYAAILFLNLIVN